jgi:hypothetical protein
MAEREWERETKRRGRQKVKQAIDRERQAKLARLAAAEQRLIDLAEMLGAGELDRAAYRRAVSRAERDVDELQGDLADTMTMSGEARELLHDAVGQWQAHQQMTPEEIERMQAPLRATGEWYVHPSSKPWERFTPERVELRVHGV